MADLSLPQSLVAAVAGALAGALVATALAPRPDGEAPDPTTPIADVALRARVDELAAENRRLRERLDALEVRPAAAVEPAREPVGGYASAAALEALREEIEQRRARTGEVGVDEVLAPDRVEEQVTVALQRIRKQEAVEGVRRVQEERLARLDRDVERLTERLGLSPAQTEAMRRALSVQYEREASLTLAWRDGVDEAVLGEQKQGMQAAFTADLEGFLGEDQLNEFWSAVSGK